MTKELSGAQWCARFPTSAALDDLAEPFQASAKSFLSACQAAGARVTLHATKRPPERGYLMHWAWKIARGGFSAVEVPPMAGVDIDWTHDGEGAVARADAIAAAAAMVEAYGIAYEPSLTSRHFEGRAFDANIAWDGQLNVRLPHGDLYTINAMPHSGLNHELWAVGAKYGVHKLASDPPHWSDDGH